MTIALTVLSLALAVVAGGLLHRVGQLGRERRGAEEALLASESRFRQLFESSGDLIQATNREGLVLFANVAWQRALGISPEVLREGETRFSDLLHPDCREECLATLEKVASEHTAIELQASLVAAGGEPVDVAGKLVSSAPEGRGGQVLAIFRNVTERCRVEAMKDEFVSTVSHELRTPLTSIGGALKLALSGVTGELSERLRELLVVASRNSDRLMQIISDMLDLQKIERGELEYDIEPMQVCELLEQAVETNRATAERLNVELALVACDSELRVNADRSRIMQVLANLISNAAKFSQAGSRVELSAQRLDDKVRVSVKDQGQGIPTRFETRIFKKFAQADGSSSRDKDGTGLGLSICKAIIEQHAGTITYDSRLGAGTTFYVELPALAL